MPDPVTEFTPLENEIGRTLLLGGQDVDTSHWQAQAGTPMSQTRELEDVFFVITLAKTAQELQEQIKPNLPWAEDHFMERVSGKPVNPPPSASYWPYAQKKHAEHTDEVGVFSHTYPERIWPKYANIPMSAAEWGDPREGIRYKLGDLNDVIELLRTHRGTRQAYLPIWFPEDTGAVDGQRVPCSLGYHFMERNGVLNVKYVIRSCDFLRHFKDDVYMAGRLGQWVASDLGLVVGMLTMTIFSLHIFEGDFPIMNLRYHRDSNN